MPLKLAQENTKQWAAREREAQESALLAELLGASFQLRAKLETPHPHSTSEDPQAQILVKEGPRVAGHSVVREEKKPRRLLRGRMGWERV